MILAHDICKNSEKLLKLYTGLYFYWQVVSQKINSLSGSFY